MRKLNHSILFKLLKYKQNSAFRVLCRSFVLVLLLCTFAVLVSVSACKGRSIFADADDSARVEDDSVFYDTTSHFIYEPWYGGLLTEYVRETRNAKILESKKQYTESWVLERIKTTDSAKYFIFRVGHEVDHRFVMDVRVYVDSLRRKLWEFDPKTNELRDWK